MNETGYVHRPAQEERSDPVLPGGWGRSACLAADGWPQPGPDAGLAGSGMPRRNQKHPRAPSEAVAAPPPRASWAAGAATQRQLDEAVLEAEQVRGRAESDAGSIVQKAEAAAEQVAQGRREVEGEIRAVKDEVRQLRADLERRETRLAEREQRVDEEARRGDQRSADLDQVKQDLDGRGKELDRPARERRDVLERVAGLTAEQAKGELVARIQNQAKREARLIASDIENARRTSPPTPPLTFST